MSSSDPGFPYHRLAEDLRAAIVGGRYQPGDRLGSEWELADRYATSRPTVRRAIALLKAEGLVVTEQGRGTFVRPRPPVRLAVTAANYRRHRAAGAPGFDAQVREQGQRPRQRLLAVLTTDAEAEVAGCLGLAAGSVVLTRQRLFLVDDEPVARCDSFFDAQLVHGSAIEEARLIPGGAVTALEAMGRAVARSVDDLTARMPTPGEAQQLRLGAGMPVIRVLRTLYDAADRPVEVQVTVAVADRHTFRYQVELC